MRWLVRGLAALAALFVLALIALAVLLPNLANRPEVREAAEEAVLEATSHELRFDSIDAGVLPPRLELDGIALVSDAGETTLQADRLALRVSLLPLLARAVVVDRIDIEGPALTLVRTEDGIEFPLRPLEKPERDTPAPVDPTPRAEAPAEEPVALAIRSLRVQDGRVTVEDRTVTPARSLGLEAIAASLSMSLTEAAMPFELGADVTSGGRLEATGEAERDGAFRAEIGLEALALEPLQELAGETLGLGGSVSLDAEIEGRADAPTGRFTVTLDDTALRVADLVDKPAGATGRLAGRFAPAEGGAWQIDGLEIALPGFDATGSASVGDATRLKLTSQPAELEALSAWLVPLTDAGLSGRVSLDGIDLGVEPISVRGALVLDGLGRPLEAGHALDLSGRLVGKGDAIVGEGLRVAIGDQALDVDLQLERLAASPRLRIAAKADDLVSATLFEALTGDGERLSGPLDIDARLDVPLEGEGALRDRASGPIRFEIAPGRLKGVSILRSTFDQLGAAGAVAIEAGKSEERLERFYEDEFERLGGTLRIANGVARSDDLRLDYRNYRVDLDGTVGLADQALDCSGVLTIFEAVDEALAQNADAPAEREPRRRVIPLAHVGGTVAEPVVSVTSDVAVRFGIAAYATDKRRDKWERKLDERLGEGAGKEVIDILDAILSGSGGGDGGTAPPTDGSGNP